MDKLRDNLESWVCRNFGRFYLAEEKRNFYLEVDQVLTLIADIGYGRMIQCPDCNGKRGEAELECGSFQWTECKKCEGKGVVFQPLKEVTHE
jgi:hypothetical protein